jgi:hypothetical protein
MVNPSPLLPLSFRQHGDGFNFDKASLGQGGDLKKINKI